jgi:replicative DNA helicase
MPDEPPPDHDEPPGDYLDELPPSRARGGGGGGDGGRRGRGSDRPGDWGGDRQGSGGRRLPHNADAEQSLLGAMLLSRTAIDVASELVSADDFYRPAHGHIYDAITSLSARGEPVDPVTVAEELSRADLLDAIGGPGTLLALQAGTPATSSAARYAKIVEEHALLRGLIGVAGEIAEIGYSLPEDVPKAVDQAESMMFEVAQHRQTDSTSRLHDLLDQTLDSLEALYERGDAITGTPTGYVDFDELTAGLQPNALVVVGARPGMGKTSFALGMASHAALEAHRPVLFFSLEMSRIELSQRLLCSEARVDSTKVRNGRLTDDDWRRISHAIGRLGDAQLWIDDNPHVTVMEIRSKARRLQSKVGQLGMIVVDYIQLMTGNSRAENRQTEVAEISRGLKILARELQCPVVALAQLNRGLEQRADKRPMLADLRESGCLTAATRLLRADSNTEVTLGELVVSGERDVPVWSLDDRWRLTPARLTHAFPSGVKPVFRMTLASGRVVEATANHRFRTVDGWVPLGELQEGARLAVPRPAALPAPARATVAACAPVELRVPVPLRVPVSAGRAAGGDLRALPDAGTLVSQTQLASVAEITASKELADLASSDVLWDRVVSIEPIGEQPVFDATVLGTHNFVANGIVAHNSLEQDADVVVFLYRDEQYNADSPDRGTAEVLVTKHRAGPTGMVRLAFLDHYTKFANMARE